MAKNGISSSNLFRDGSQSSVQVGGSFVTADATTSPKTSPLSVSSAAITLSVPNNATKLVIVNSSAAIRVSESSGLATYFVIGVAGAATIPCAKMDSIYIVRDSADSIVQFYFESL